MFRIARSFIDSGNSIDEARVEKNARGKRTPSCVFICLYFLSYLKLGDQRTILRLPQDGSDNL